MHIASNLIIGASVGSPEVLHECASFDQVTDLHLHFQCKIQCIFDGFLTS